MNLPQGSRTHAIVAPIIFDTAHSVAAKIEAALT